MNPINNRITPDLITNLKAGEIFVFGSNARGMHAGGAARFALYCLFYTQLSSFISEKEVVNNTNVEVISKLTYGI